MKRFIIICSVWIPLVLLLVGTAPAAIALTALSLGLVVGLVAEFQQDGDTLDYTPTSDVTAGTPVQLADGRVGIPANDIDSGRKGAVRVCGVFKMTKTSGVVLLDGGRAYLDHSAQSVTYRKVNDQDFYLGVVVGDAASADTTVMVAINVEPRYLVDVSRDPIDSVLVLTAGTPQLRTLGGAQSLEFSATDEAQKVDVLSKDGFAVGANAIVEGAIEVVDNGDSGEGDFNVGVANATHASDADSITESCFIHIDTNALDILAESDDGTTEVAATDTTVNYAVGTRFEFWMDLRDPSDIQIYINGSLVLSGTTFDLSAATGPLKLLAHLEKSGNDTPGEFHVDWLRARIAEQ